LLPPSYPCQGPVPPLNSSAIFCPSCCPDALDNPFQMSGTNHGCRKLRGAKKGPKHKKLWFTAGRV
jgi:hypothetical protein